MYHRLRPLRTIGVCIFVCVYISATFLVRATQPELEESMSRLSVQLSRRERPPPHRRRKSSHRSTRPMRGTSTARRTSMPAKGRHMLESAGRQPRRLRNLGLQSRLAAHSAVRRSSRASVPRSGGGSSLLGASLEGKFASLEGKFEASVVLVLL